MVEETTEQPNENNVSKKGASSQDDSKYRKIILAAQRSKQLQRGADPRVEMDPRKSKATRIAMKELDEGKIDYEELNDN